MQLTNVLMIDDDENLSAEIQQMFEQQGITVTRLNDSLELSDHLKQGHDSQMVILDWLLDDVSSDEAKACLKLIRKNVFVPVLIWTNELPSYEEERVEVEKLFPSACLNAKSKQDFQYQDLLDFLQEWHEGTPAKLSEPFRATLRAASEEALYTLAEHSEDDLARGLQTLIKLESDNLVDIEHSIDVLLRLVRLNFYQDADFTKLLGNLVASLKLQNPPTTKAEKKTVRAVVSKMQQLHMYYNPIDVIVRTGDIVEVPLPEKTVQCIVITPACDLAQPQKTIFLRLALLHQLKWKRGTTPPVDKQLLDSQTNQTVCFHEILVVKNLDLESTDEKSVMSYSHTYQTFGNVTLTIKRLYRLDEPYRSDLLHAFVSHAGRIGKPDFSASQ